MVERSGGAGHLCIFVFLSDSEEINMETISEVKLDHIPLRLLNAMKMTGRCSDCSK